jgi:hypothetical protein
MEIALKTKEERLEEVINVMKSIRDDLKLPMDHISVLELKKVLNEWVMSGKSYSGVIDFRDFDRMAEVNCPVRSDKSLEVKLRIVRVGKKF